MLGRIVIAAPGKSQFPAYNISTRVVVTQTSNDDIAVATLRTKRQFRACVECFRNQLKFFLGVELGLRKFLYEPLLEITSVLCGETDDLLFK